MHSTDRIITIDQKVLLGADDMQPKQRPQQAGGRAVHPLGNLAECAEGPASAR
jgi:hypothetical protein